MKEIKIINDPPIIFTKDRVWLAQAKPEFKPGAIVVLPEDAILYVPSHQVNIQVTDYSFLPKSTKGDK